MVKARKVEPNRNGVTTAASASVARHGSATAASEAGVHRTRVPAAAPDRGAGAGAPAERHETIGVRELRDSFSERLRSVRAGKTLTVTDHGEPVAMLIPYGLPAGVIRMLSEGRATWSGRKVRITPPKYENTGQSLSDLVIQMREEHERELDEAIRAAPEDVRR